MPYPHPPRNDGRVTLRGVDVLSALMPDSAEMLGRHLLLIGSAVTLTCTALHIDRALAHSGNVLHTGTVTTPHSRVGLLRGALSESGNKEKYALVNITGRTEHHPHLLPEADPFSNPIRQYGVVGTDWTRSLGIYPTHVHLAATGGVPSRESVSCQP